jgi:hypothetical protein
VACRTAASSTPQQQSRIGAYRGPRATLIFAITRTMMRCTRSRTNDVERITSLRGALWPSSGCWKLFRLCSSAMRWANGPVVAKRAPGTGHRCRAHQRSPSINDTKIFRTVRSARALSDQPKRLISIRFGGKGKSVAQEGWKIVPCQACRTNYRQQLRTAQQGADERLLQEPLPHSRLKILNISPHFIGLGAKTDYRPADDTGIPKKILLKVLHHRRATYAW